jgi:hypothetical protein
MHHLLLIANLLLENNLEGYPQDAAKFAFAPRRDPAWLQVLDSGYQDLVKTMRQKGFTIEENASDCKRLDVLGVYTSGQRTVKICTDRMAQLYGESSAFLTILQQTIAHEAVHVAQGCRQRRSGKPSLDLPAARLYGLPKSVRADIQKGLAMNTSSLPRSVQWRNEAEAMAMEDQPEQVIAALQQFCR